MTGMRRVGVFVSNSHAFGQEVLEGISTFCQPKKAWKLAIAGGDHKNIFRHLAGHLDGVIAGIESREFSADLAAWGKPCVNVFPGFTPNNSPKVYCDARAVGRAGAEHLLGLGCKRFALCCFRDSGNSRNCRQGFEDTIRQAGGHYFIHEADTKTPDWASIWKAIADWVASLPKPIGLMAVKDSLALEVLEACVDLGIRVPDQVAVVGAGNDILLCQRANPPLSSIDPGNARIGFKAATLLEEMMSGKSLAQQAYPFPPVGVVSRTSTETLSLEDPQMAKALHYIREHACDPMQIDDLLSVVPLSRRSLQLRFIQARSRSVHEEIRRIQIQRATRLLTQTYLPLDQIARASGFGSPEWMAKVFRKQLGVSPSEHRRRYGSAAMAAPA